MNTLTDPLKRIARELVDRKLWPVAVLLLAALVALPILIGGGSSTDGTAAPVAPAAAAVDAPGAGLITVADPAAGGKETRPGRIKDPFYDPPAPPAAEVASVPSPAASAPSGAGSAAVPKGGGTPATASPPAQATPPQTTSELPTKTVAKSVYYRTVARWYAADPGKARPLARLSPLGGSSAPLALYLGVTRSNGLYAVFLLAPDASSEGDAECDRSDCRVIGLKAGESQIVTMPSDDGGKPRRYRLEAVSVKPIATDAATAGEMRAKVHSDGRDAMRQMWRHRPTAEALQPIRYDSDRGLLFRTPAAKAAK